MLTISVIYPRHEGSSFDFDYYERTHLAMVADRWKDAGLEGAEALRGIATPDGKEAPFFAIALIRFASADAFEKAIASEDGAAVLGDIPNFTDVRPIVQLNEAIGGEKE